MATKKKIGGGFQTDYETRKWNAIQKAGSVKIDKVLSGTAAPEDIKTLSAIISKQHLSAGKLFDDCIKDVEKVAKIAVKELDDARVANGKPALGDKAYERVFQRILKQEFREQIPHILEEIKDHIDLRFEDSVDATKDL